MQFISYIFFRLWIGVIWLLPFKLLYAISDLSAWMMNHVFKYRRRVVDKNLKLAFPDLNDSERENIRAKSFQNLCDIIIESFKGFSLSPDQIKSRYTIKKPAYIDQMYDNGQNIVLLASHMGNWEWATYTFPMYYPYTIIGMIKPVKNKYINAYTNRKRCSTGTKVIDIYKRDRSLLDQKNHTFILVYISDQNPSDDINSLKVNFFGMETYALHGAEKIAIKNNWVVIHLKTERVSRGRYELTPELITTTAGETNATEITQIYFDQLESYIKDSPESWLWTHKRWKRNIEY